MKSTRILSVLTAALLVLAGCAGDSTPTSQSGGETSGGSLSWGWHLPSTWDPVTSTVGQDVHVLSLAYAALTKQDVDGNAAPALAESWEYNATGDEVTFTLREGLTFTDGTPLDAEAVRHSLLRGRDAPDSTIGAQLGVVTDVRVDSPTEVTLLLNQPDYQIPLLLSGKTGMIVSPSAVENDVEGLATAPVGAGPFALDEYVPASHATLHKNEDYWDAESILVDDFELRVPPDPTVAVAGVQSGQFDVAVIPPAQIEAARAAGLEVDVIDVFTVRVLDVDNTVEPFDDPRVTQAISHAINRQELVDVAFFGEGDPNWQPFPSDYLAWNEQLDELYTFDQDRARQLLAEAGYPDGVAVTLTTQADNDPLAELLQQQLQEVGIDVTLEVATPGANNYVTRQYPFVVDSFSGRESPLQALEVLFGPEGLMNLGRNAPPEIQQAIDVARATPLEDPGYEQAVQDAVAAAVTTMPNTFLFTWPRIFARDPSVQGFEHYIGTQRFEGVTVGR
ncbi:ABC transporter substrate-binding protein [Jiangella alkaliphila]|uniref:Peptide/nickel transport system substrate-binding protein n=1 Tax=Jiangella alkaliphila TaxID=419479 RepID=A0A1H2JXM5_9ACTN|nr:ABC transporter substrate-binding protein [Jiangella alkaliphila]SDU60855.1 peptide/nickel transport system substrate-binding protein [Jiangella alkaliphila]